MMVPEIVEVLHHVPSLRPGPVHTLVATPSSMRLTCGTRAVLKWLLFMLAFCLLVTPVAAQPDYTCGYREPISAVVALLLLAGHHAVIISGTLTGPAMGISSVLWLVMRNDAAIEPRWSWM